MIRARFRIALPEAIRVNEVSRAFPDVRLRLLTGVPLVDVAGALGVDASTASETVRRGAGRVLEPFLRGPA